MKKLAVLIAMTLSAAAQADLIDNFNVNNFSSNADPVASGSSVGNSSAGYARTLTYSNNGVGTFDARQVVGTYQHHNFGGSLGDSFLTYDLGGALNLTAGTPSGGNPAGGMNAFRVSLTMLFPSVGDSDLADVDIAITAFNGASNATVTLDAATMLSGSFDNHSYADFLFSDFAGIDFTDVTSVRLGVYGSAVTTQLTLDDFETVCTNMPFSGSIGKNPGALNGSCTPSIPEPASLSLLGLGLVGLAALRRRRAA